MAADQQAAVHLILGLLDRHSFKTLELAVQQFKDHKEKFRESLFELKSVKPSISNTFTHPSSHGVQALKPPTGEEFPSVSTQARCTPLKPPTGEDFPSVSTQARCTPLKPPLNSTFVQEGIENHGCKPYTLRPRASRKLSSSGAPQRITRSRAKQPATSTAAVCNNSTSTESMVLEDGFVEVRAKVNRKPGQHQQASFQGECPTEAAVSGCAEAYPNQRFEQLAPCSQDVIATTDAQNLSEICKRESSVKSLKNPSKETCHSQIVIAAQKQPEICKRELTPSSHKHPGKETFNSGDPVLGFNSTTQFHLLSPHLVQQIPLLLSPHLVQQIPLLNKGNSVTPCQNTVNYIREDVHVHHEEGTSDRSFSRNHTIGTGATVFAKSPSACIYSPTSVEQSSKQIIDAIQCKAKQEIQLPTDAEDGPRIICPKKNDALNLQPSPITLKHSPPSTRHEFNGTDIRQSNSRKRKLSVRGSPTCGMVANDDLNFRKRISSSFNSTEMEAFRFDVDDVFSGKEGSKQFNFAANLCKVNRISLRVQDVHDQARRSAFKGASTPGIKDSAKIKEFSIGTVETGPDMHANGVALEKPRGILSQAHYEAAGSGAHAWDNSLQGVLKNIPEVTHALLGTRQVTTQKVHEGCETIEPSFDNSRETHTQECNNESKQVSPLESNLNSPAVCFSGMVQPEQEKVGSLRSKSGLLLTSAQFEPCLRELPEEKLTLCSKMPIHSTKALASRNTAVVNDDLSSQDKAIVKLKFSPAWENCKEGDAFISPKLKAILQNRITLSPGMRRTPALNGVDPMVSNLFLSASKSTLKHYSVNGGAELTCDDSMPNLKTNEEFASVPTSPCGSMSSAGKEPDAADNVLVGPDVDTSSLYTEEGNTHDMEEKTLFSVETKEGLNTQLGDTFESADVQVVSDCGFASKESIKTPGLLTSDTEAGPNLKFEEGARITEETNSLRLAPTNCELARESSSRANEDALPAQVLELEDHNLERSAKSVLIRPNSTVHIHSPMSSQHEEELAARLAGVTPQMKETESCCLGIKLRMPCSQDTECQPSWIPEELHQHEKSNLKSASLGGPSFESPSFANEDALPGQVLELEDPNLESSSKSILMRPNSTVNNQSPILSQHEEELAAMVAGVTPQMKETESCCLGIKLEMPYSQVTECQPSWIPEELHQYEKNTLKSASLGGPSPSDLEKELRVGSSICIPDTEMKKRTADKSEKRTADKSASLGGPSPSDLKELRVGLSICIPDMEMKKRTAGKSASLGGSSPSDLKEELRVGLSICIPDMEMKKRTADKSDFTSNSAGSQMDCSESPSSSFRSKEIKAGEDKCDRLHRENKATQEWKLTPKGDEATHEWKLTPKGDGDIMRFNQLLAQGTVNSKRRKRARSPANCSEESFKDLKKMKLSVIESDGQISCEKLSHAFLPQGPSFGKSNSSLCGFPPLFSPIRRFQDTFRNTFQDNFCGELPSSDGLDSLQRQVNGSDKLCKSYSRLSGLRREYLDTPHIRSARAGLVDRTSANFKKFEWHLDTHLEDGKENQTPEPWLKDKCYSSTSIPSEKQATADTRKVLGHSNQSLRGPVESTHKRYNLAIETRSFLDLVQQTQLPLPYPNGKREVRVKALEAAELARRQEERRENERKMRRLECNEAKNIESEGFKDKMISTCASTIAVKGISDKVKRVAELKMKLDQEKAKKQVEQKKKEEGRKKKEVEFADKKRKREDADRKDREEKRKRVEEVQRLKKEQEERQRLELEEKEHKRKMLEERERERKAQEEEAKKQRRLEKEKEAERRRKQEQHLKASRLAEKQAERKRKEALLQVRGYEDDPVTQIPLGNKLSLLSTESFAVSTSTDWEAQSKSIIRTRSQTSEDIWGLRVPYQINNEKLSTSASFVGNGTSFSTKAVVNEAGFKFEAFKGLKSQYSTPSNLRSGAYVPAQQTHLESNIQSYEISPYKSSSDDEDDDDQPKKPIPLWARKENLLPQILWQQCMDPDDIFSTEKTCSLGEIFGTAGSRRCKDFTQRSTSGDWLDDHATWMEELDYKKAMGYIEG